MSYQDLAIAPLSALAVVALLLFLCTKRISQRSGRTIADPHVPAFPLPYFGHSLYFLLNPERFLRGLWSQAQHAPVFLRFPGRNIYLAKPGEQVRWLFKPSTDLVSTPSLLDALETLFGLPMEDQRFFLGPDTINGDLRDASQHIMSDQRRDFNMYLRGMNLDKIMLRFADNLLQESRLGTRLWMSLPDLYTFVTARMFRAEVRAIYGEHIFEVCPTLREDFETFYKSIPTISRKTPKWFSPSSYTAQRKMQQNFSNWRSWCKAQDLSPAAAEAEYEPIWGCRYVRQMVQRFEDLGLSDMGIASTVSGFFFVTFANSLPTAAWMLLHIFMDPDLLCRIQAEVDGIVSSCTGREYSEYSEQINAAPLLNSIYCETLRLYMASTIGRTNYHSAYDLGKWRICPGIPVMATNWLGGLQGDVWNTGKTQEDGAPQYPLDTFWADRFIRYSIHCGGELRRTRSLTRSYTEPAYRRSKEERPRCVTSGLRGHWFPFGGGPSKCPGELLAKNTILCTVVMILSQWEVRLDDPHRASQVRPYHRTLPFGLHSFDKAVAFHIRERVD